MFAARIAVVLLFLTMPFLALAQPPCPGEPPIAVSAEPDVISEAPAQPQRAGASPSDDYTVIEPAKWRTVRLSMDLARGGHCDITLLRPLPWVNVMDAKVGGDIDLQIPEMGVAGAATVIAIEPCPEIEYPTEPGARPVIGKFVTTNARVVELLIEGLYEPIAATASHPFWSLDRDGWAAAGDLQPGEKLRTIDGSATVTSITQRPGTETVYNIEVHGDHTYFVSDVKLLVHNVCVPPLPKGGWWRWSDGGANFAAIVERQGGRITFWEADLAGPVGTGAWKSVVDQIKSLARAQGMTEIRIVANRISGAAQGARDIIIRLN